jgi:hypothetical protein
MGAQLNYSTTVDGLIHDWRGLFDSAWFNFNNLVIISFYNFAGMGINNMTISCFKEILFASPHLQTGVVLSGAPFNQELTQAVRMTSPSSPGQMHEMLFAPKDLVTIQAGRLSVSLYPKVKPRMPVFERAHAFQVAKSTLEALNTDTCLILEAMGAQLNCNTTVDGLIHDWHGLFDSAWFNFNSLVIISFHNFAGTGMNNTTIAGNPALLLPVVNGPVATCCQEDVHFVCVICTINFTGLVLMPNYGPTTLCIGFYLELPQSTVAMVNGINQAYNLTIWHGAANLTSLTSDKACVQILEPTLQDGPIALRPANFNLGNANIDTNAIRKMIYTKIIKLGF